MISRRTLLNTAGATAVLAGVPLFRVHAEDAPIKLGCIEDNSGVLDIYGKPIVMANALAVEEINAAGGLLGRKIELKQYEASRISRSTPSTPSSSCVRTRWTRRMTASPRRPAKRSGRRSAAATRLISTTSSMRAACATAIAS